MTLYFTIKYLHVLGAIVILGSRSRARFPLLGASLVWWVVSLLVIYRFYR